MEQTLETIRKQIRFYPDFPEKGVMFIDLLPLLANAATFSALIGELNARLSAPNIAAPEARGFLFAAPLLALNGGAASVTAFRKGGKTPAAPGDLVRVPVVKEYGEDSLYFRISDIAAAKLSAEHNPVIEITVLDDVLATGGTARGMAESLDGLTVATPRGTATVRVVQFLFLAEITALGARPALEKIAPVTSLLSF